MRNLPFILLFIVFSISGIHANTEKYYFKHFGLEQGLSQSSVLCIIQDQSGFMWFGTKDGLNRYDGNSFRIFQHIYNDSTSLGNNVINSLLETKDKDIWVGTDAGIYIYHPTSECFTKFEMHSQDGVLITQPVYKIIADSKNNIWMAVESQGVFCYDIHNRQLSHYTIKNPNEINSIAIDYSNTIWVGYKGKGLYYTNDNFKSFHLFTDETATNIFADDHIFNIMPDNYNHLYIGSSKGGLKRINKIGRAHV